MEDGFPKQTFVSICHVKIVKKILHPMREQLFGGLWLNLEAKPCFDYFWLQQPASASVLYSWSMWETTRRPGIHHILYDIAHTHVSYNNYIIILYNMKEHCYFMHIIYIYIYVDVMCTSVYHAEWCWGPEEMLMECRNKMPLSHGDFSGLRVSTGKLGMQWVVLGPILGNTQMGNYEYI